MAKGGDRSYMSSDCMSVHPGSASHLVRGPTAADRARGLDRAASLPLESNNIHPRIERQCRPRDRRPCYRTSKPTPDSSGKRYAVPFYWDHLAWVRHNASLFRKTDVQRLEICSTELSALPATAAPLRQLPELTWAAYWIDPPDLQPKRIDSLAVGLFCNFSQVTPQIWNVV